MGVQGRVLTVRAASKSEEAESYKSTKPTWHKLKAFEKSKMMAIPTAITIGVLVVVGLATHIQMRKPYSVQQNMVQGDVAAAFADQLLKAGILDKYDADRNGQLNVDELHAMLADLGTSRLVDGKVVALVASRAVTASMLASTLTKSGRNGQQQQESAAATTDTAKSGNAVQPHTQPAPDTQAITEAVPGSCPQLTRQLVESFAVRNTIMITVSDWRIFQTFGISWLKHLQALGVGYFLVGATDKQTASFLAGQGRHPCFQFFEDKDGSSTAKDYKYGDQHYNQATWRKVTVVQQIVSWGFNVIHSDVDVVWFRDPLPYFLGDHLKDVDFTVSTDLVSTHAQPGDEGLEPSIHAHVNFNTGIYFIKSSEGGRKLMLSWADLKSRVPAHLNDQTGLYEWVRDGRAGDVNSQGRYLQLKVDEVHGGGVIRMALLGVHMMMNGYTYFIPKLHEKQRVKPLGVHMTWVPLSKEGKLQRLRDGGLYHDAPAYYEEPLYLSADLETISTPADYNDWKDTEQMVRFHLDAMDKQLVQVYRVMAIAVMLKRTLVLPRLQCFCYKNWFMMEQCRIPGDKVTQFPLQCTLDQVCPCTTTAGHCSSSFRQPIVHEYVVCNGSGHHMFFVSMLLQWLRPKVVFNYGPNIIGKDGARPFLFRESSVFDNSRFPKHVLGHQLVVQPGDVTLPAVSTVSGASLGGSIKDLTGDLKVLTLPFNLTQNNLKSALEQHARGVKILHLRQPMYLFGGWDDMQLKTSFEEFLEKATGNWCCRDRPFVEQGLKEKEKLRIHW